MDETEAYLRHRARVHEREKREKLKKQGKLDAYLEEIEKSKPKSETRKEKKKDEMPNFDKFMQEYYEIRKFDKENLIINNVVKLPTAVENSKTQNINIEAKKKTKKRRKAKKKIPEKQEEQIILNEAEFKPTMAGSTGLPKFFFNNLVKENRMALQEAQARHRMDFLKHHKNH